MVGDAGVRGQSGPPGSVLAAFGVRGAVVRRLPGGQGGSWLATAAGGRGGVSGRVVLKPVHGAVEAAEVTWLAEALGDLADHHDGFRLAAPVRSTGGTWVVGGWRADTWVAGQEGPAGRWVPLLAAAEAFHAALAHVPRPSFLDRRDHRWARADRAAWGEQDLRLHPDVQVLATRLRSLAAGGPDPGRTPSRLVHGDLSGNVLFADGLPPTVIDVSAYWRPAPYGGAVAVADGLLWHDEGAPLLTAAGASGAVDLVARAVLFRLLDHHEHLRESGQLGRRAAPGLAPYRRTAAILQDVG